MFYSIPFVRNMIAAQQMDFVGKMIQSPLDRPSRNMITACCNHKRQTGQPQTTGKNFMVENLQLLFCDIPTVHIDRYGSLRNWIHEASNKQYWGQLVDRLIHPATPLPERPADWGPLPSWQARRNTSGHPPPNDNMRNHQEHHQTPPPPNPRTPQYPPTADTAYDPKTGYTAPTFAPWLVEACTTHSQSLD